MAANPLEAALEREHRVIDGGIEEYAAALERGVHDPDPLRHSLSGLRRHIYLEERFLFPPLREAGLMMPIMVMLREHGSLWRAMDGLDGMLAEDAGADALLSASRELLAQLDKHNSKEEPILYARADEVLDAAASSELSAFLDDGRLPEGWVCEGAAAS